MFHSSIKRLNRFLDQLIAYKGIDKETLEFKKTYWSFVVAVTIYVVIMTVVVDYFNVTTLVLYGIILLAWYIPFLIVFLLVKKRMEWLVHLSQHIAIFITFFCVIKIGGIPNSGGAFLATLSTVIFSIVFYSIPWSIWYFTLFVIGTFVCYHIPFALNIPPEMSPRTNDTLTLINTLSISGLILAVVLVYLNQYTRMEKERADRLKEINEAKTKFYTNITHEFRTPITIILANADQIESKKYRGIVTFLDKIRQNSNKLLSLVNQMLNLSKLESGRMAVNYVQGDIVRFIKTVAESFEIPSKNKSLSFKINCSVPSYQMDYEPDKLTQIICNLLGNALKFTPENGAIELKVIQEEEHRKLTIIVSDNGIGIPPEKINRVFDRFYQVNDESGSGSSGLGLAITRELVHLLHGEISIESTLGAGTTIKVVFPVTNKAPHESQPAQKWMREFIPGKQKGTISLPSKLASNGISSVLIIEDNEDVTDYLGSLLEGRYQIASAKNGVEGLKKSLEMMPDVIISDIMMPEMDGIEMLRQLKADIRTSHIPVILLTAKADMESKIEGISTGAEAYLSKPFNKEELYARLASLIKLRKELQKKYSNPDIGLNADAHQQDLENSFMRRISDLFNKNIDNEEIAVSDICEAMNMSRSQLYRKFRVLTNRSVSDYFRSFRLHRAKKLLQDGGLNVTQVALEVGFKNLSHFSKAFQSEFGTNPSNFKR